MSLRNCRYLPLLLLAGATTAWSEHQEVFVGVLEDLEASCCSNTPPAPRVQVRVAFTRSEGAWTAVSPGPEPFPAKWNVALDGKKIGVVSTATAEGDGQSSVAMVTSDPGSVPRVKPGKLQVQYANPNMHAVHRPLLVSSAPHVADPEGWKRVELTSKELKRVRTEFRKVMPLMEQCEEPETPPIRYVPYPDEDIILEAAYRAKDGRMLVGQKLPPDQLACGFYDDHGRSSYWLAIDAKGTAQLIGLDLIPLEAADLDADGRSEWLFKTRILGGCSYNDAYILFHDGFARRADYVWSQ